MTAEVSAEGLKYLWTLSQALRGLELRRPVVLAGLHIGYEFLAGKHSLRSEDLQCLDASVPLGPLVW